MTRSRSRGRVRFDTKYKGRISSDLPTRVLIVTEGEVTEKEYFECLRRKLDLGCRQVVVISSGGETSPTQVVEYAQKRLRKTNGVFKYVYCVFDMDGKRNSFKKGIEAVQRMKKDRTDIEKIEAITSVPCFEFWLWLHVSDRKPPYPTTGSPCKMLKSDIRKFDLFENYSTAEGLIESIFSSLDNKRSAALRRARSIFRNAKGVEDGIYFENPSTRMYVIVEDLERMSIKSGKQNDSKTKVPAENGNPTC